MMVRHTIFLIPSFKDLFVFQVCLLLKDSQYINPTATDGQVTILVVQASAHSLSGYHCI